MKRCVISLLFILMNGVAVANSQCPDGWTNEPKTYYDPEGASITVQMCLEPACGGCKHVAPDGTACCCTPDYKVPGYATETCNASNKNYVIFHQIPKTNSKGETVLGYGCCPATAEVEWKDDKNHDLGEHCCLGKIYKEDPNDSKNLCCTTTLEKCDDGTQVCGGSCCPEGEEEYIPDNGVKDCCLATRLYRDDNGQQACCASDVKEVNGEKVCMGCKDGEVEYNIFENGKIVSKCCAGKTYNCNDEDEDGVETCSCCPKCTEDADGDAPDRCGLVRINK